MTVTTGTAIVIAANGIEIEIGIEIVVIVMTGVAGVARGGAEGSR